MWLYLKCIKLSESSLFQKTMFFMITCIWHSGKGKTIGIESRYGWGFGREWNSTRGDVFWELELFYTVFVVVVLTTSACTETQNPMPKE